MLFFNALRTNRRRYFGRRMPKRVLALVLCACFLFVGLTSMFLVSMQHGHIHDRRGPGGCCAACAQLDAARELQKLLGLAVLSCCGVALCTGAAWFAVGTVPGRLALRSPVAAKVRMNN